MQSASTKVFRFGVFEADAGSGELRKSGVRMRLQEQPFQVLLVLLERPGQVVSRDELRQQLWPADTFVDFDHSLNTIVNKLREVLGDSASSPRYIETLAKRGYRFVAPIEVLGDNSVTAPTRVADSASSTSLLTHPDELPAVDHGYVRVLFVLIQIMYLIFYVVALARIPAIQLMLQQLSEHHIWIEAILVVTAVVGIPVRFYLLSSASFDVRGLGLKFLRLFFPIFILDELGHCRHSYSLRRLAWVWHWVSRQLSFICRLHNARWC
jgi:DNA-binding winged helix-turn-helix (wHTH) protein